MSKEERDGGKLELRFLYLKQTKVEFSESKKYEEPEFYMNFI
jgi:hypothetical protein